MGKCQLCKKELPPNWVGDHHLSACVAHVPRPSDHSKCRRCMRPLPPPNNGRKPFTYCYVCYFEIFKIDHETTCQPLDGVRKGWKGLTNEGMDYSCEILPTEHKFAVAISIGGRLSYRSKEEVEYIRGFVERVDWYEETPDTIRQMIARQEKKNVRIRKQIFK